MRLFINFDKLIKKYLKVKTKYSQDCFEDKSVRNFLADIKICCKVIIIKTFDTNMGKNNQTKIYRTRYKQKFGI